MLHGLTHCPRPAGVACAGQWHPGSEVGEEDTSGQWHPGSEVVDEVTSVPEESGRSKTQVTDEREDEQDDEEEEQENEIAYSDLGIHREMVEDTVRTEAFRKAIFRTCKGKVVLEVGCGTGILSVFAAQAGASRVVAVEANRGVAAHAQEVVNSNGFQDVIQVLEGRVEDIVDEVDAALASADSKADVIISEWMGFMLVCEAMFPSVAFARDRWLREGGSMLPSSCGVWTAPFNHAALCEKMTGYWRSQPYGVDFSVFATPHWEQYISQPVIATLPAHALLAKPAELWHMDCNLTRGEDVIAQNLSFEAVVTNAGGFHGMAVWFTCELCTGVSFSTSPEELSTHWEQTLLFVDTESPAYDLQLRQDDAVVGEVRWLAHEDNMAVVILGQITQEEASQDAKPVPFGRRLDMVVSG